MTLKRSWLEQTDRIGATQGEAAEDQVVIAK